ncbi:MAG: hypothetical protein KAW45_02430 [Thermoplasmatales archaeon]|nr:hypothetical protein [Thermoplasmatales archaeon]
MFYYDQFFLKRHGILTEGALKEHTKRLSKRGYLYIIRDRSKPIHFGVPWKFMLSKSGLGKLEYENLISKSDNECMLPILHQEAEHYGVRVRG